MKQPSEAAQARHNLPIDPVTYPAETSNPDVGPDRHRGAQRTILAVIACAGIVGALLRYAVGRLLPTPDGHFPWSTFWINGTGSFVIGLVLVLLSERFPRARVARPLIVTGFLGAYTTFSTFMVDTDTLVQAHRFALAAIYAGASLGVGVMAALTGVVLARFFICLDHRLNEQLGS